MKKELLISVIIGFGLGLIITFGVYQARQAIKTQNQFKSPVPEEKGANITPAASLQTLSLVSPLDQTIIKEAKTPVSGVTSPLSWVVILGEKGEKVLQADSKGNFETQINLISGENEIQVISVAEDGQQESKTITVVYSTAEI